DPHDDRGESLGLPFGPRYEFARCLHAPPAQEARIHAGKAAFQNPARRGLRNDMRSIGSRLTYWYVLVVFVTVVTALLVGRWLLERQLIHGMDLLNVAEFEELADRVKRNGQVVSDPLLLQRIAAHSKIDSPLYFFQLRDRHGEVLFRSANMGKA